MKDIVLLTDFGLDDNFVGIMKGVILKINSRVNLIDLCHNVRPQDIFTAGFLLRNSYRYFPRRTIFLVVVDPGVGTERKPIIVRTEDYYFVGPDNGVLSIAALADGIRRIVAIENKRYMLKDISDTFHGRDVFAPVCAYLSKGKDLSSFGRTLSKIEKIYIPEPEVAGNILKGEIIYVDRFGNLVANINKNIFRLFVEDKRFTIEIHDMKIYSIDRSYQEVRPGELVAVFGSSGFLEISINKASANEFLKSYIGQAIKVTRT